MRRLACATCYVKAQISLTLSTTAASRTEWYEFGGNVTRVNLKHEIIENAGQTMSCVFKGHLKRKRAFVYFVGMASSHLINFADKRSCSDTKTVICGGKGSHMRHVECGINWRITVGCWKSTVKRIKVHTNPSKTEYIQHIYICTHTKTNRFFHFLSVHMGHAMRIENVMSTSTIYNICT